MLGRGDYFEMKFIVKCCKFVKHLVKICRYIWIAKTIRGSVLPPGPTTSAHTALLSLLAWATWAEVVGPGGVSGQKSNFGSSMYPSKLNHPQFYKHFCEIVVYPNFW